MANLDELRQRINGAEDMQAIVRVMKTLSAVSITQYQNAARRLRAYQEIVDRGLHAIMLRRALDIAVEPPAPVRTGLIAFGSDQGLCGRFNEMVVEHACAWLRQQSADGPVLVIGARGASKLEAEGIRPDAVFSQPGSVSGLTRSAESILLTLDHWRDAQEIEKVVTVFNVEGRKGIVETRVEAILPIDQKELVRIAGRAWPSRQLPVFDGNPRSVFSAFVRERLYNSLMRAGAESLAAEHATRLSAMQAAERNITEKLDELQGVYRRERQDAITNELLDIVSAYGSLT